VLYFAGSNSKGHRAKGAVGRSVRIPTHHRHTRHRESQLGAHHVDDALFNVAEGMQPNAKFFTVLAQGLNLDARGGLSNRLINIDGGGVVVFGSNRQIRAANLPAGNAKPVKSLGAGDFVNKV